MGDPDDVLPYSDEFQPDFFHWCPLCGAWASEDDMVSVELDVSGNWRWVCQAHTTT